MDQVYFDLLPAIQYVAAHQDAYQANPNIYLEALNFLRIAATSHATIRLGWIGGGFLIADSAEPCVAKSRALVLFKDQHGKAVISFYHAM